MLCTVHLYGYGHGYGYGYEYGGLIRSGNENDTDDSQVSFLDVSSYSISFTFLSYSRYHRYDRYGRYGRWTLVVIIYFTFYRVCSVRTVSNLIDQRIESLVV